MLKKIFKKKKNSQERPNSAGDIRTTDYLSVQQERPRSVEATTNPMYVLREKKNDDEIRISYYSTDTYINVDNKRPCYENLDKPQSLESVLSDNTSYSKTYDDIWHCKTDQKRHSKSGVSDHMYEACNAAQIQEDQLKDVALQKWYFGYMGRSEAETKLINTAPSTFLVRQSNRDDSYILSLKLLAGPVAHIRISRGEGYYSLQGSVKSFYTIGQLVTFFAHNEIVIRQLGLHQLLCHGLINR